MTKIEVNPILERHKLTRLFGGSKSSRFSCSIEMKIESLEVMLPELIKPLLYYQSKKIDSVNKCSVDLMGGLSLTSPKLSKSMNNCEEIVCFIATIGNRVENEIKRLFHENHPSEAFILDAMGSVAVENMVEKFHQRMRTKYNAEGKKVSLRFSPGYCDWPLTDQKKLFSLFDSFQLNVRLTDSCLMQPRKSISGVFGVIPSDMSLLAYPYNPCLECERFDCIARRP